MPQVLFELMNLSLGKRGLTPNLDTFVLEHGIHHIGAAIYSILLWKQQDFYSAQLGHMLELAADIVHKCLVSPLSESSIKVALKFSWCT